MIHKFIAIVLAGSLTLSNTNPARSQAQVLLIPAACATGVGCVLIGTVIVAGVVYYVYQSSRHPKSLYMIEDPDAEMGRMGGHHQTEPVTAGTRKKAEALCQQFAKGRTLKQVKHFRDNQWECIYY